VTSPLYEYANGLRVLEVLTTYYVTVSNVYTADVIQLKLLQLTIQILSTRDFNRRVRFNLDIIACCFTRRQTCNCDVAHLFKHLFKLSIDYVDQVNPVGVGSNGDKLSRDGAGSHTTSRHDETERYMALIQDHVNAIATDKNDTEQQVGRVLNMLT